MTTRIEAILDLTVGMYKDDYNLNHIHTKPASEASVERVLKADPTSLDGRSNWLWFRLPNGDLILGVFPEGDTYCDIENDAP